MGSFCCKNKHYAKMSSLLTSFMILISHLNPKGFIMLHECTGHGVLMISINFQGFNFKQQRLLPLDWNENVIPLN